MAWWKLWQLVQKEQHEIFSNLAVPWGRLNELDASLSEKLVKKTTKVSKAQSGQQQQLQQKIQH